MHSPELPQKIAEKNEIYSDSYSLYERHYSFIRKLISRNTDLDTCEMILKDILENTRQQQELLPNFLKGNALSYLQSALRTRREELRKFLKGIQLERALQDFPSLQRETGVKGNLEGWLRYQKALEEDLQLLKTYSAEPYILHEIRTQLITKIHGVKIECHSLRKLRLQRSLKTDLYIKLPITLRELGKEVSSIDQDLFLLQDKEEKEALEIKSELLRRRNQAKSAIQRITFSHNFNNWFTQTIEKIRNFTK